MEKSLSDLDGMLNEIETGKTVFAQAYPFKAAVQLSVGRFPFDFEFYDYAKKSAARTWTRRTLGSAGSTAEGPASPAATGGVSPKVGTPAPRALVRSRSWRPAVTSSTADTQGVVSDSRGRGT
jgi:hypothetical protein